MDNSQERLVDVRFLAGLIVGEGHFGLFIKGKQKKTRNGYIIQPVFQMHMTDLETMKLVVEAWKDLGLPVHLFLDRRHRKTPILCLDATGLKRVRRVIEVFGCRLTGNKKVAADAVSRFIESRLARPARAPYSKEEMEMVNLIRDINAPNFKRGKYSIDTSTGILRGRMPSTPRGEDMAQATSESRGDPADLQDKLQQHADRAQDILAYWRSHWSPGAATPQGIPPKERISTDPIVDNAQLRLL